MCLAMHAGAGQRYAVRRLLEQPIGDSLGSLRARPADGNPWVDVGKLVPPWARFFTYIRSMAELKMSTSPEKAKLNGRIVADSLRALGARCIPAPGAMPVQGDPNEVITQLLETEDRVASECRKEDAGTPGEPLVGSMLRFTLLSRVTCDVCHRDGQEIREVHYSFQIKHAESFADHVNSLARDNEVLEYQCGTCKRPCSAQQRTVIETPPREAMLVDIARGGVSRVDNWRFRAEPTICFKDKEGRTAVFNAAAVIAFSGNVSSGHYIAKYPYGDRWLTVNDAALVPEAAQGVLERGAVTSILYLRGRPGE